MSLNAKRLRNPYTEDMAAEVVRIEQRRIALGVELGDLADKAGMGIATLFRIRRTKRAFRRQIKALSHALRSLEQEKKRAAELFPFGSGSGSVSSS